MDDAVVYPDRAIAALRWAVTHAEDRPAEAPARASRGDFREAARRQIALVRATFDDCFPAEPETPSYDDLQKAIRRNGEHAWISWTNRAIRDARGELVGSLCIGNDVTAARTAELEWECAEDGLELSV